MATVAEMGTQEWMERELAQVRAAVDSWIYARGITIEWTAGDIAKYVSMQPAAVRIMVEAAFDCSGAELGEAIRQMLSLRSGVNAE